MGRRFDKHLRKAVKNNMQETWNWFAEIFLEMPFKRRLFLAWRILINKDIRK